MWLACTFHTGLPVTQIPTVSLLMWLKLHHPNTNRHARHSCHQAKCRCRCLAWWTSFLLPLHSTETWSSVHCRRLRCTWPPSAGTYRPHHWWRTSSTRPNTTDQKCAESVHHTCNQRDIHSLGVRPGAPGEPIFTKFCTRVRVPDVFLSFEFQKAEEKCRSCGGRNFPCNVNNALCPIIYTYLLQCLDCKT